MTEHVDFDDRGADVSDFTAEEIAVGEQLREVWHDGYRQGLRAGMKLTTIQEDLLAQFGCGAEWFRPMDLGGADGTNHSAVLAQLERRGLIESRQRGAMSYRPARGAKLYKLTYTGIQIAHAIAGTPARRALDLIEHQILRPSAS